MVRGSFACTKLKLTQCMLRVSSSVSPTIPTILSTRRSLHLRTSRRTKRMLSQKESVESDTRVERRALCCKEKNALIERVHRKKTVDQVGNTTFAASFLKCKAQMNAVRIRLKEFPHWIFLFTCTTKGAARGGAEGAQAPPLAIRILMFIS